MDAVGVAIFVVSESVFGQEEGDIMMVHRCGTVVELSSVQISCSVALATLVIHSKFLRFLLFVE